jgi:hypothetical protein
LEKEEIGMTNKVNEKRKNTKLSNMMLVKQIITEHHTRNLKKIKQHLKDDYKVKLSDPTIKRYKAELKEIDRLHKKQQRDAEKAKHQEEKTARTRSTALVKKKQFPMAVKDPSGKQHIIQSEITSISLTWSHGDGMREPLTWGPISQGMDFWHWENSGIRYGDESKSKVRSWRMPKSLKQRWADGDSL